MNKGKILLSSIASLAIFSATLMAEDTQSIDSVDVWETEVVSSSLNLGKSSIETKQADHLSDLLRDLPGVDVGGTHSINNRINIRGLQDDNLDITIDGAKVQNANMFHHIGNLLINPDILKKAVIQVGNNSVVNGSLGGAVSFETKDGKDMLIGDENYGARIATTYNSNDSLGGSLSAYGKITEDFSFLLYHNYVDRDNWETSNGDRTYGKAGTSENTLVKGSYDISDTQSVSLSYDILVDEGDYLPRPNFSAEANFQLNGANLTYDTKYTRETITLKHELDLGDNLYLRSTVYTNENELERYETGMGSNRPTSEGQLSGKVKTAGFATKGQSNFETGSIFNTLVYGVNFDKQTSKVTWNGSKYGTDEETKSLAIFLEDTIDFENGLLVTPGVRYNNYKYDGAYGNISDDEFTYGLAGEYAITDTFSLLASATTLYKGVEMVDVLDSSRVNSVTVNNLKAETGINKEFGFRYIQNDVLGADTVGFMFKYFMTDIDDYIDTEVDRGAGTSTKYNNGTLSIQGYEASFKYILGNFSSLITYSHSSSLFEETGVPAYNEAGDNLTVGLDYKVSNELDLSWNSMFAADEDHVDPSYGVTKKEGYDVHNLAATYKPSFVKNLTATFGIDNIFDEEYISHTSDYRFGRGITLSDYEPGRNFKVTLAYKF